MDSSDISYIDYVYPCTQWNSMWVRRDVDGKYIKRLSKLTEEGEGQSRKKEDKSEKDREERTR